jgi:gliding motility-associated-like protein
LLISWDRPNTPVFRHDQPIHSRPRECISGIRPRSSVKLLFIAIFALIGPLVKAQDYYIPGSSQGTQRLWHTSLPDILCNPACSYIFDGYLGIEWSGGISFGPDSFIYILTNHPTVLYRVDPSDASHTAIFEAPADFPQTDGLVAMGGGIFYTISRNELPANKLYEWDINAGTINDVGSLSFPPASEMCLINGMLHYVSWVPGAPFRQIIRMEPGDVSSAEVVVEFKAQYPIYGITASPYASLAIGIDKSYFGYEHLVSISLGDGTVTDLCKIPKAVGHLSQTLTSMYEHTPTTLSNYLDLDCDDSSLATQTDYNSTWIDCLSPNGAAVCDHDLATLIDAPISTMTITVANPVDGDAEILYSTGDISFIEVSGEGTNTLTLTNEGGAQIEQFQGALKLVRYDDTALLPTPGMRTIQVVVETTSGNTNPPSEAYIEVRHRDQIEFDLGPTIEMCEGGSTVLDANIQFVYYLWSTDETTETITVTEPGTYFVSVTSGLKCPNADTIEVVEIPIVEVRLIGDSSICREEEATLTLTSDADFPIDVEILINGGYSFWLYGVEGEYSFAEFPYNITEYTINEVLPSESSCIEVWDDYQVIEVYQAAEQSVSIPMCDGDSVQIQNNWIHAAGSYPVNLQTIHGCDSLVTYHVTFNPAILKTVESFTCDASAAGTFVSTLINPAGCDTVLTSHVILTPADTTQKQLTTCAQANAGVFQTVLQNQAGCDSVVVSTVIWEPPVDSTFRSVVTCDVSQHGTFVQMMSGSGGCDSVVVTHVIDGVDLVTHLSGTSCDIAQVGVFEEHFLTATQCDSAVITTITFSDQTTTFFNSTTCDPSQAGVFVETLTSVAGCDSIVTNTVTLLPVNETNINSTTCDPSVAGSFTQTLSNQYGCDSVVNMTITLLPTNALTITSTSCNASEAGTFVNIFVNQYGCDSTVTSIVSFAASDTLIIEKQTCDPLEVEINETLFVGHDGCDSLVIEETRLFPLPSMAVETGVDYNGYDVPCYGNTDATLVANVQGVAPYSFEWSTGSTDQLLTQVGAGEYSVVVTDANGCKTSSSIVLIEPEPLAMSIDVVQPDCANSQFGEMNVSASGGVGPIQYALNNQPFQSTNQFNTIGNGDHTIVTMDANGCQQSDGFTIASITNVHVELGDDQSVILGETIALDAIVNIPKDSIASIQWSGMANACEDCLGLNITPTESMTISISITDIAGCVAVDEMRIEVRAIETEVYFPNVFSPDGDGINDRWFISSGSDITEVIALSIFDRWGNLVFGSTKFPINDPAYGWDGSFNEKSLNPGVFVYKALVRGAEGNPSLHYGDITLIR